MAAPAIPQQQAAPRTRNREAIGWQRPWWLDAMLAMYLVIMLAALAITAHGTKTFYGFILPTFLAYAATVVLSLGIPVLEYAAITAPKGEKKPFIIGVVFLVGLETLAQYYQAQASFTAQIRAQFSDPAGIDLATFAMQSRGRLLPLLFLSALPLVVLGAGYAATHRWLELCATRPQPGADLSTLIADLRSQLAEAMQTIAGHVQAIAGKDSEIATLRDQGAKAEVNIAAASSTFASQQQAITERDAQIAAATQAIMSLERNLAAAQVELASPTQPNDLMIARLAKYAQAGGASWDTLAGWTGIKASTLRSRVAKVED